MAAIRPAATAHDVELARALFMEYAKWLDVDLCFQGFDAELVTDEAEPVTCAHPSGGFRHLKTTYTTLSGHQPARWGGLARTRPSPQFRGVGKTL